MSGEMWTFVVVASVAVVVTAVAVVVLTVRLVRARRMLSDAGIPLSNKLTFWGAIAYVVSPVDLLPDPVLLDDIGVLLLALRSLYGAAEAAGLTAGEGKGGKGSGARKGGKTGGTGATAGRPPGTSRAAKSPGAGRRY